MSLKEGLNKAHGQRSYPVNVGMLTFASKELSMGGTPFTEPDPKSRLATQIDVMKKSLQWLGNGLVRGSGSTQDFILYSEQ